MITILNAYFLGHLSKTESNLMQNRRLFIVVHCLLLTLLISWKPWLLLEWNLTGSLDRLWVICTELYIYWFLGGWKVVVTRIVNFNLWKSFLKVPYVSRWVLYIFVMSVIKSLHKNCELYILILAVWIKFGKVHRQIPLETPKYISK